MHRNHHLTRYPADKMLPKSYRAIGWHASRCAEEKKDVKKSHNRKSRRWLSRELNKMS